MVVRDLYTALEVGVKKSFQIFREKATALGRPIEKLPNSPTSVALGALNIRKPIEVLRNYAIMRPQALIIQY